MRSKVKSVALRNVIGVCVVLMGVAVSSGSSCFKPTGLGAKAGNFTGTVDSNSAPIAGITVIATRDSTGLTYTGVTAANGSYSITSVPDGSGTISLGTLPSGCVEPAASPYDLTGRGTQTFNINVVCTP